MFKLAHKLSLTLGVFTALATPALAAAKGEEATSVPEPSVALLGGLCGILFLLWRRK